MCSLVWLPHWGPGASLGRLLHKLTSFMTKDFPPIFFFFMPLPPAAAFAVILVCLPAALQKS